MEKLKVYNPFNLELLDELEMDSEDVVFQKLENAYAFFQNKEKWLKPYDRIQILEKLLPLFEKNKDELVKIAAEEGGKPWKDSLVEVERGIQGVKVAIHEIFKHAGEEIPMSLNPASMNRMAYTLHEPRGVVLAISAFNHPFNLIIHQVIPAIATSCPVLVKPASTTPRSCKIIIDLLHEAGAPQDFCQMILCKSSIAEKVVKDRRISFMTFIGSAKVGWYLRSVLSPGASCALEHGGLAPVIIDQSADWQTHLNALVRGAYYHAGQVCVSVQRIYLHESLQKDFLNTYMDACKKLIVGDSLKEDTDVGPLILPDEVKRVDDWVKEAVNSGAEILCGGKILSDTTYEPTVLLNPSDEALISQKEIFGPVSAIYTYSDFDEAIKRANEPDVSFQSSILAQDIDVALSAVKKLNAQAVMVNDHTAFRVDWMPFGGSKDSGLGLGGIGPTMEEMTHQKLFVIHSKSL